jgi:hypothetical protein
MTSRSALDPSARDAERLGRHRDEFTALFGPVSSGSASPGSGSSGSGSIRGSAPVRLLL